MITLLARLADVGVIHMYSNTSYRMAVIGLGHYAIEYWLPGIIDSRYAQLIAVCDIDKTKTEEIANKFGVQGYTDYSKLLELEPLDFVIAITPHDVYRGIIEEAARKGVHVLKEKPFARNLSEGLYLNKLCQRSGIHLMTAMQRRFSPIYTIFFQLIDKIGEILFIEARYTLASADPNAGWRGDRNRAGGGCLVDMGYHTFDMIIWYFGLPDKVIAEFLLSDTPEENAFILFGYNTGVYGLVTISRNLPPKSEYIRVRGTKGLIEVKREAIRRLGETGDVIESFVREAAWPPVSNEQIDYFCRVIRGEAENIGSPSYHLQHLKFIEACYESKRRGQYVNPKSIGEVLNE